jgi:GNAT superfamily N-acetyltransferase
MTGAVLQVDRAGVVSTLVLSFCTDPLVRWLLPATDRYLRTFPALLELGGAPGFAAGTADLADCGVGAALWLPPDPEVDDAAVLALLERRVDPPRHADVLAFVAEVEAHRPPAPHWYLLALGTDPHWQGRGYGSALLRRGLSRCDADGLPAYLEASAPGNRALYTRHGFTVVAEVQVGDSPPVWPMVRPAR